jgi:heptosyltransferase-3
MTIKKKINTLRANAMRKLTRNIGSSNVGQRIEASGKNEIKRVLVSRPNHRLGNLLLMTPLVQEISETLPNAKIDLFVKGNLAPVVFKNFPNVDRIIQLPKKPFNDLFKYLQGWLSIKRNPYDIVINVDSTSSSGRLSVQFANAKHKFFGDVDKEFLLRYKDHEHMAKYPVYVFRNYLNKPGSSESERQIPTLNIHLSASELEEGKKILHDLVRNDKKTICLFTNATGSKIYPESWWQEFYGRLKTEFPDYNIIEVLPVENTSQIGFKAPTYANKDIRTVGSFIANTQVFIGADSGMMHLASAVQTPTIGLFKVTNTSLYEPYNPDSRAVNTTTSSIDDCIDILHAFL